MEKLVCENCGATITPNNTETFLKCEYCGTTAPNPWYSEEAAKEANVVTPAESCVALLKELGGKAGLKDVDEYCFGDPLGGVRDLRKALNVPEEEKAYLAFDHLNLLGSLREGFLLTDTGLYYKSGDHQGFRDWETFVRGAIACTDQGGWLEDGVLTIGGDLTFDVDNDQDSKIARFLVEFHNQAYRQLTGETAPAAWTVTSHEEAEKAQARTAATAETPVGSGTSVVGALLTAATGLLTAKKTAGSILQPQATRTHRPVLHPVSRPAARPAAPARANTPDPRSNVDDARELPRGRVGGRPAAPARHGTPLRPSAPRSAGPNRIGGFSNAAPQRPAAPQRSAGPNRIGGTRTVTPGHPGAANRPGGNHHGGLQRPGGNRIGGMGNRSNGRK